MADIEFLISAILSLAEAVQLRFHVKVLCYGGTWAEFPVGEEAE